MSKFVDQRGTVNKKLSAKGVMTITFHHPLHNSFPLSLLQELASMIEGLNTDKDIRVIVLKSAGERTFCSGASFNELLTINNQEAGRRFFSGFAQVINSIRLSEKIVIGQVQGKAIGGGVGLAAACDYCFATEQAAIRLSELGVNIGPFVIAPAVERKIGLAAFTELTLNPDVYKDAHWAKGKGLYQEVFTDLLHMEQGVQKFTARLSQYNPKALQALKRIFWENTDHWTTLLEERANISGALVLTQETKASLQAFKNKK